MRRSATRRWASRRTTIPTRSCRSATRWGGSDRLAAGPCPKSSTSTAGATPIPKFDPSGFRAKARKIYGKTAAGKASLVPTLGQHIEGDREFADSPLEQSGFELPVPLSGNGPPAAPAGSPSSNRRDRADAKVVLTPKVGPAVRIRFLPAASQQTFGS